MTVYDVLVGRTRLQGNQLFIVGHGANHPIVSNATLEGKRRNRRVELVVIPSGRVSPTFHLTTQWGRHWHGLGFPEPLFPFLASIATIQFVVRKRNRVANSSDYEESS